MVESAAEFAKAGFNEADAAQLAKVSSMYQNIADEQLSAGEASEFIISQMKAFNITAEDSLHIADAVNNVSNNMSVSSADLARNLGNMSAAMSVGGNTMEESIGLLTGITEITRSAASASRALVTVQSRFNQIVDESSSTGQNLLKWYTKHGIAVKDDAGQLRSLYDVMSDLAPKWNSLSKNEQAYFMQQQAGARQSQNLAALLSNFKGVQEATALAYNSSGSAAAENAKVLESLDAKTTALKATWEDFANKTINSELVKSLLNLANGALKILNTDVGRTMTQFILLNGVFTGLGGIIGQVIPAVIKAFTALTAALAGTTTGMQAFQASIPVVGVALSALTLIITGVTSAYREQANAATEVVESINPIEQAYKDSAASAEATALQGRKLLDTLEDLNKVQKLSTEQTYRYKSIVNQLNELYPSLNLSIDEQTGKIKQGTEAIEARIDAMKAEALQAAMMDKQTAYYKQIVEAQENLVGPAEVLRQEFKNLLSDTSRQYVVELEDGTKKLLKDFDIDNASAKELQDIYGGLIDNYILHKEEADKTFGEKFRDFFIMPTEEESYLQLSEEARRAYVAIGGPLRDLEAAQEGLDGINASAKTLYETYIGLQEEDATKNGDKKADNVDGLKQAYDALNDAVQDYNTYGGLQSKTQEALDEALPGLTDMLYDETGAITEEGMAALKGSKELTKFVLAQKRLELQTKQNALQQALATQADIERAGGILTLNKAMQLSNEIASNKQAAEAIAAEIAELEKLLAAYDASERGGSSAASSTADAYKKAFTDWLAYKDHQLAMDEITEEQYYAELTEMVDKFFKGRSEYQEEYWQYSEKIYAYEKKRMQELVEESTKAVEDAVDKINEKYDSELSRLEEVNDALSDQIEYEKLLDEMAKAREQKKLVYKDGRFQYVQDADAISAAQAKIDEYNRNKGLEASKADIEARRKAEVRQTILDKMQANSAAWATSSSPAEREALHNANVELAKLLEDNSTYDAATGKWSSYAGGTLGASGGMSLVGENGPEMRILNRGDGILTSGVTKNLFAWGSTSPSDFVSALKGLMGFKLGNSSNTTVNVNNLELPNVTNAREFVTGLKNLALQYAYERG